jgi:hypothetical protein
LRELDIFQQIKFWKGADDSPSKHQLFVLPAVARFGFALLRRVKSITGCADRAIVTANKEMSVAELAARAAGDLRTAA